MNWNHLQNKSFSGLCRFSQPEAEDERSQKTQFGLLYLPHSPVALKYRLETDSGRSDYLTKMAIPELFKLVGQTAIDRLTFIQY